MRYTFQLIPALPVAPDISVGIQLTPLAPPAAPAVPAAAPSPPATPVVDLAVVGAAATVEAAIGGAAEALLITLTNVGSTAGDGAIVTAPWLADNADRTFGALTATPSAGVVLGAFDKTDLVSGATIDIWPAGGTIDVAVDVTAVNAFVESFISQVVPAAGVTEASPADNTCVITAQGVSTPSVLVAWRDFVTPSNINASTTAGVKERPGGSIGFCGDDYTQVKNGFGVWGAALTCPPSANATGARWQIVLLGYNPANTYTVVQDYSGLSPPPATYTTTFVVAQTADILTITTAYTLLGATVGDGIASAGNALFEVFENGVSIGTVTLVLVMY